MSSQSFSSYATPLPHSAFSSEDFASLKISQVSDLTYPTIAKLGSLCFWDFSTESPRAASATIIIPGEVLPHYADLLPMTKKMEEEFKVGARSVKGEFIHLGKVYQFCYVFSKINLIRNVTNYQPAVDQYRLLLNHLEGPQFELGSALDTFRESSFCATINGLTLERFPLHNLACLLGETWLEEVVFNGLAELSYLRECVEAGNMASEGAALILPTTFLINARAAFHNQSTQLYMAEIRRLRRHLQVSCPRVVAMGLVAESHFTAYIYRPGSSLIEYGDSLHHPPPSDMLEVFQWIFSGFATPGLSKISGSLTTIEKQGAGSGSCGIAAYNFIDRSVEPSTRSCKLQLWAPSKPQQFRDAALQDLLLYHHAAEEAVTKDLWYQNIFKFDYEGEDDQETANAILGLAGYDDYICHVPSIHHPIHVFHEQRAQTKLQTEIHMTLFFRSPSLPMVHELPSIPLPLLPPFPIHISQQGSISAPPPKTSRNTPPQPQNKKRRHQSMDNLPVAKNPSTLDVVDLCSPAPGVKMSSSQMPIPLTKMEYDEPDVIDLCTPPQKQRKFRHSSTPLLLHSTPIKREIKRERDDIPSVIDLCTPEPKTLKAVKSEDPTIEHKPNIRLPVEPAPGIARENAIFDTLQKAQEAIYAREERLGHCWIIGQSRSNGQGKKRVTFCCNHYREPKSVHSVKLDPADHRNGKSIRTGCEAHVNVNRMESSSQWRITKTQWDHNHPPEIPMGGAIRRRPTEVQKEAISRLATTTTHKFSRGHISEMLKMNGDTTLEPRQIGNIMNSARKQARDEIDELGGDMNAILASLQQKMQECHGWWMEVKVDENSVVTGVCWQSPEQVELCQRYGDVLISDNTYNCNWCGYPLNIGVVIDNHNRSRNILYAFHAVEDESHHSWVLRIYLKSAGYAPDVFVSDRSKALIASVKHTMPNSLHILCIDHLQGNIEQNLSRLVPSGQWLSFKNSFWEVYRAVSPDHFDQKWDTLTAKYPQAKPYLESELYECREQWAWAWLSHTFTCGVRTNGRVEVENRITKTLANPKTTLKQLFDLLNSRTNGQTSDATRRARETSRRQHDKAIESIFPGPLSLIREFAGPYALNTCWKQMQDSMFYQCEVLQLPDGMYNWNEYAIAIKGEMGYCWQDGEEKGMLNKFDNDNAHISTTWLLRLIRGRGLRVEHLLRITHRGTEAFHMLAILSNNQGYVCDCCMGMNVGIPCRHYFRALSDMKNMKFSISLIRARWYQDKELDVKKIPQVFAREALVDAEVRHSNSDAHKPHTQVLANPLQSPGPAASSKESHPSTQTIPARTVYHESNAVLKSMTAGIQTQEQLEDFISDLQELSASRRLVAQEGRVYDPPSFNPKGRPREVRLTGPTEGRPRGGGANSASQSAVVGRKCGICKEVGHNRARCPYLPRD